MCRSPCVFKQTCFPHPTAPGSAEARWPAHPARGPSRRQPDAGAVRQDGGRQHQNEAPNGGDLRAFNRQRQAVVQVEVTSYSSLPPFFPPQGGTGEMVGSGADNRSQKGPAFAACHHSLLPPHTIVTHFSLIVCIYL